ncbi:MULTISPECIES: tyrosine-type recombinase/integrase [Mycobacterium]|jgi:site-specific recombinase XerD|uniref:Transposase n=1 Tax=Mycobacterium bouchedurhonense TaxID=701041 RepID=A0AAW5SCH2_MYCBC|nr:MULTISPECIES: tyrosine-type recombinase/integrase [Mycobacterium]TXA41094.1 transposase [Mycobacterium tuberculosis variant bovis]MCV6992730.1 tyrosine-type recombinase/integrase [Mycobacterium bouchedurhonense]MCV6996893.1 tyrosine-type recombinase/integrase [Mycobacterium timonense]MCV7101839.1 tyrosine-type recombinase/integrase [Mycobacterium palustre]MDO2352280.1 tyrosine-type recombinase/integrase [Mycobacterium avium subsp. hominissuis]
MTELSAGARRATLTARVRPVTVHGSRSWTLVDERGLPLVEVEQFLNWLRAVDRSSNTVRSYALHLALLYRWLRARGIGWECVTFDNLCDFVGALSAGLPPLPVRGGGSRSTGTVKAVNAAVREFYEFHRIEGRGPKELVLTRNPARAPRSSRSFLAHVQKKRPQKQPRLARRGKPSAETVSVIDFETDFAKLQDLATSARDRLLLSALYDVGLRVGQALGLRHADLDPMRRLVWVRRRTDNANGVLSKQRSDFSVDAPQRFFDLYAHYLLGELRELDTDYVFVNLSRQPVGKPLSYSNAHQLVARLGSAAGIDDLHPHVLRHTHATALARAGWTAPEIAARLGQSHASSADVYIHLAADHLGDRLRATEHLVWRPAENASR